MMNDNIDPDAQGLARDGYGISQNLKYTTSLYINNTGNTASTLSRGNPLKFRSIRNAKV
jgi:hypothetical protein